MLLRIAYECSYECWHRLLQSRKFTKWIFLIESDSHILVQKETSDMFHQLRKISFLLFNFWLQWISSSNFKKYDAFTPVPGGVVRISILKTHIYIERTRVFMNAFVGKILAICKCKKRETINLCWSKYLLWTLWPVYGNHKRTQIFVLLSE